MNTFIYFIFKFLFIFNFLRNNQKLFKILIFILNNNIINFN